MKFEIAKNELEKLSEWKHDCKIYTGAISGRITYCFTNTSLGQIIKVKCACGEEIDLTDYNDW